MSLFTAQFWQNQYGGNSESGTGVVPELEPGKWAMQLGSANKHNDRGEETEDFLSLFYLK